MNAEKLLWVFRIILGALFIIAGGTKLLYGAGEDAFLLEIYQLLGEDPMLAAAMCELGGGIALLIPIVSLYASLLLMVIMIIATAVAMILGGIAKGIFPLIILCILIGLVFFNQKYAPKLS